MRRTLATALLTGCTAHTDGPVRQGRPEQGQDETQVATDSDSTGPADDTGYDGPTEMRGIWVTRWSYSSAADVQTIVDEVAAGGFNAIFFQIRGNFDAYYASDIEPWAARLTGTLGQDPGWDPLATAVEAGHAAGLQVHADMNVFPFWSGEDPPPDSVPEHAYNSNPEWLVADSSGVPLELGELGYYVFASPGNPEVQARVAEVAQDLATRYDVDGIHLDYVRYPGADYSHDAVSEERYAADTSGLGWADWEREQVKATVRGVYAASPVPVTAAVWGIYADEWGWGGTSEGNEDYYQDSRAFLEEGILDANVPMIYWPVADDEGDRLDFRTLVADHVAHASGRHVYAGFGNEISYEEAVACVEAAREEGAQGVVLFDYSLFRSHLPDFQVDLFAEPAEPPPMPWR